MHRCQSLLKEAGYIKGAAMVSQLFGNLEDLSAQAAMETKIDLGADIGMRQWFYQSCTEFGFWQNVNPDFHNRTRSVRINAVYHNNLCQRLFGMNANNVESTNLKYYAPILEMSASAILFTNGEEDPWMNLSIVESQNPEIETLVIKGAAHCDDLGMASTQPLREAMQLFDRLAKDWLL